MVMPQQLQAPSISKGALSTAPATNNYLASVGNAIGRVARAPLNTAKIIGQSLNDVPTRIIESINPNDDESEGDNLLKTDAKKYGFTPQFTKQIHSANPTVTSGRLDSSGLKKSEAAGTQKDNILHRIQIAKDQTNSDVLRHEGLHDSYDTLRDSQKQKYAALFNRASKEIPNVYSPADPNGRQTVTQTGLANYLNGRLHNYKGNVSSFSDIEQLPSNLRDEVHAYVPEYFDTNKVKMPSYLADYYANYYQTGGRASGIETVNPLEQLLGRMFK